MCKHDIINHPNVGMRKSPAWVLCNRNVRNTYRQYRGLLLPTTAKIIAWGKTRNFYCNSWRPSMNALSVQQQELTCHAAPCQEKKISGVILCWMEKGSWYLNERRFVTVTSVSGIFGRSHNACSGRTCILPKRAFLCSVRNAASQLKTSSMVFTLLSE